MKFNVRDEDGREFEVEEIEEVKKTDAETEKPLRPDCNDDALSPEEIASLKKLAAMADKLCALVDTTDEEVEEEEVEEEIEDEDEEEERIEEVIDTDTLKKKASDSIKRSAGAIEKKRKAVDSVEEDEISAAWERRYGGNQ